MKGKYRDADSHKEINSILNGKLSEGCLVWQNVDGVRLIYKIKKIDKSEDGKQVMFQILDYEDDFKTSEPIYVKLSYRGTMFRSEITTVRAGVLYLKFPLTVDVKTIELRSEPRITFDLNEDRFVTLGVLHGGQLHKEQELKFQVVDISESGICLLISDSNKEYLKNSNNLVLTKVGKVELNSVIKLDQKYNGPFRYRKNGKSLYAIRAGFKFSEKLEQQIISQLINEFE